MGMDPETTPDLFASYGLAPASRSINCLFDSDGFSVSSTKEALSAELVGNQLYKKQRRDCFYGDNRLPAHRANAKKAMIRQYKYLCKHLDAGTNTPSLLQGAICLRLSEQAMREKKLKPFWGYKRAPVALQQEFRYHSSGSHIVSSVLGYPVTQRSIDVVSVITMYSRTRSEGGFMAEGEDEEPCQTDCTPHFVVRRDNNRKYHLYFRSPSFSDCRSLPDQGIEIAVTQDREKLVSTTKAFITAVILKASWKSVGGVVMEGARRALNMKCTCFVPAHVSREASAAELGRVAQIAEAEAMDTVMRLLKSRAQTVAELCKLSAIPDAEFVDAFNRFSPKWLGKLALTADKDFAIEAVTGCGHMLKALFIDGPLAVLGGKRQCFPRFIRQSAQYLRFMKALAKELSKYDTLPDELVSARAAMNRFVFTENTND